MQEQYFVYLLLCADRSYYTALTTELEKRLAEHQSGTDPGCYTYSRRPVQLVYYEIIPFLKEARDREKQLKKWSRAKKKALVESNWHKLQLLSECQNLTHYKYKDLRNSG